MKLQKEKPTVFFGQERKTGSLNDNIAVLTIVVYALGNKKRVRYIIFFWFFQKVAVGG